MGGVYEMREGKIISDLKNSLNERISGFMREAKTKLSLASAKIEPEKVNEIVNKIITGALEEKKRNTAVFVERPIEYERGVATPVCISLCTDEGNDLLY